MVETDRLPPSISDIYKVTQRRRDRRHRARREWLWEGGESCSCDYVAKTASAT
jgi:hypothetical protein